MSLFPSVLFSSLSNNLVLTSFLPSHLPPCAFLPSFLTASDIQTLPRVYFFDSYATLQANGSDSRFLPSSACHTHIPHSHLCLHYSFVFCPPTFWLLFAVLYLFLKFISCCSVVSCYMLLILLSYWLCFSLCSFTKFFAFSDSAVLVWCSFIIK